jgi:hypothetical protein
MPIDDQKEHVPAREDRARDVDATAADKPALERERAIELVSCTLEQA